MIRVSNIKIDIDDSIDLVKIKTYKKLKINEDDVISFNIYKESIDARKKGIISFVYTVDLELKNEKKVLKFKPKDCIQLDSNKYEDVEMGNLEIKQRPVIVGSGPAGLFATLLLAQRGYNPILIERGMDVDTRSEDIENFWKSGKLNTKSNVQFGEGGAGTFSDGKLTTRMKDIRCEKVLSEFVKFGAPEDILYSHKPHVGTDILKDVVKNIRKEIIRLGGEVFFDSKLTSIDVKNGEISSIEINESKRIDCQHLILAIGHSARDTYKMIYECGAEMEQKPFAIGVRIEHPQEMINKSQYGKFYNHKRLGAADYRLTAQTSNGRSVYTFCMCPGGMVIASANSENELVTNGMSEHSRDKENANSGLLVNVETKDFDSPHPLAGLEFQRKYESLAFKKGGANYNAPAQLVGNFLNGKPSEKAGSVTPSYRPGVKWCDISDCLPDFVIDSLKEGLVKLNGKLKGFSMGDAVMTGIETRSSAPVRIKRDRDTLESVNIKNLFPCGEGAGYAGGIVTAAVDGIKCAEKIITKYSSEGR
ncbi:NAD(P)/FAD-dependent oxidoreductase [Peptostreptococcus faecalis]|uniref:NAD(P)/FAD-dependent oxidoreductase n=1 Tax=Peptostreptococcus faecalis TaxID=2045015 RepID=UPI000C7D0128|nr:FAD-dependent oxidoreductase [Peptostreptococcus faecalis]